MVSVWSIESIVSIRSLHFGINIVSAPSIGQALVCTIVPNVPVIFLHVGIGETAIENGDGISVFHCVILITSGASKLVPSELTVDNLHQLLVEHQHGVRRNISAYMYRDGVAQSSCMELSLQYATCSLT